MPVSGTDAVERELRETVALAHRVLCHQGLVDYLGHCSARVPGTDRVIIKPKHSPRVRSLGDLTADDMMVIDLDGNPLDGTDGATERPPAECFIHTEIYRTRPDVTAIAHTHQPAATLLGIMGGDLLPVLHVPSVLVDAAHPDGPISTWPCPLLVNRPRLGAELAAALGSHRLCHLQGHGIVSVADDMRLAVLAAIATEQLAEANLTILRSGLKPRVITPDELAELSTTVASLDGRWAYYTELVPSPHHSRTERKARP
jgi:ribulose-5-phosphate 4-epimerase/fuculose-1-phosphate aldolase